MPGTDKQILIVDDEPALLKRSEEHTSELQSPCNLECRLPLEKNTTMTAILVPVNTPGRAAGSSTLKNTRRRGMSSVFITLIRSGSTAANAASVVTTIAKNETI